MLRVVRADGFERLLAGVVDLVVTLLVMMLTAMVASWIPGLEQWNLPEPVVLAVWLSVTAGVTMLELGGLSAGKFVGNMRIVSKDGFQAWRRQLAVRWGLKYAPLLLLLGAIGLGAVEAVLETQRSFELNVSPALALEALFVRVRRTAGRAAAAGGVQR